MVHNIIYFFKDNLTIPKTKDLVSLTEKKYEEIISNCEFFKYEIDRLFFLNLLQAQIILVLIESTNKIQSIIEKCSELKNNLDIFEIYDDKIQNLISNCMKEDFKNALK